MDSFSTQSNIVHSFTLTNDFSHGSPLPQET
jgi:hypothetical protein